MKSFSRANSPLFGLKSGVQLGKRVIQLLMNNSTPRHLRREWDQTIEAQKDNAPVLRLMLLSIIPQIALEDLQVATRACENAGIEFKK